MLLLPLVCAAAVLEKWDVVVYGTSPAGIAAATAAGHLGLKVAVYEPLPMIGGMGAAGFLGLHDGAFNSITGLAMNWSLLNGEFYNRTNFPIQQPESFAAAWSMNKMLADAGVRHIQLDCRLTAAASSGPPVSSVTSISVLCEKEPVTATVFIDASYDGDIMMALPDVRHTAGRESIAHYNESRAGARTPGEAGPKGLSALRDDGVTLLKYVANITELAQPGEADDALMAFQHRFCVAKRGNMSVPWPKPKRYDREDFQLMQRCVDANFSGVMTSMPPSRFRDGGASGKTKYCSCCGISACASDQPNLNKGWATASWERRQEIIADHTYFELGSYYYLANDPQVPDAVRNRFSSYGLCADEFQEFGNIPPQLYVRISNRLVGDYVMTQNNIAAPRRKDDSIAVGNWWFDEHPTGKYGMQFKPGQNLTIVLEGAFFTDSGPKPKNASKGFNANWYDVPYKIMLPQRGTGANLLVPVALSASAVAYSSTRIESMFMAVGSAAGVAAKQLVDGTAATVQDVNVSMVQRILNTTFKQQTHGPPPPRPSPTPPSPSPSGRYYNVSGAGSAQFNGKFVSAAGGQFKSTTCASCALYAYGGVWRLALSGQGGEQESPNELVYVAGGPSKLPPLTGWTVASDGKAPAPMLNAGTP